MRRDYRSNLFFLKLLLAASVALTCFAAVRAETYEVQAVMATDPGKPGPVPPALVKHKSALASCAFGSFADNGKQTVNLTVAAPRGAVTVGAFTLELTRQALAKSDLTVKEGGKTVYGPIAYTFAKEKTKQVELATPKGTYIVFITLEKE